MLIALPNPDGSFTCTLFFPHEGEYSFSSLSTPEKVLDFFSHQFSDAVPLIPNLAEAFFANPTGNLVTVKCFPWHYQNSILLMGDAAHAIVPFFGQGMNCGFEDCTLLDECIEQHGPDWISWCGSPIPCYLRYANIRLDASGQCRTNNISERSTNHRCAFCPVGLPMSQGCRSKGHFSNQDQRGNHARRVFRSHPPQG